MSIRFLIVLALLVASCSAKTDAPPSTTTTAVGVAETLVDSDERVIPPAPDVPTGPLPDGVVELIEPVWQTIATGTDPADVAALGAVGDPRIAWLLSDLLRFVQGGPVGDAATEAFTELTGAEILMEGRVSQWRAVTDLLIAWDIAAPPDTPPTRRDCSPWSSRVGSRSSMMLPAMWIGDGSAGAEC